jgi:predicted adenine nucleotide alpha hydrolase (AANH) superfamily ATPase
MRNVLHYKIFDSHVCGCKYSMIIQEKSVEEYKKNTQQLSLVPNSEIQA